NEYHIVNRDALRKGSIELCGEKIRVDFFGVVRDAIYCEEGARKTLLKEKEKWESGEKSIEKEGKLPLPKVVLMPGGERVEINQRVQRSTAKRTQPDASPAKCKRSRGTSVARGQKSGGKGESKTTMNFSIKQEPADTVADKDTVDDVVAVPVDSDVPNVIPLSGGPTNSSASGGRTRRERRLEDRANTTPSAATTSIPTSSPLTTNGLSHETALILNAVREMRDAMTTQFRVVDERLNDLGNRIVNLEDLADEIADGLEQQGNKIGEVATATPSISTNSLKAAKAVEKLAERLPLHPPSFSYKFIKEERVRVLDKDSFLSFANRLDRELFTPYQRRLPLNERDQEKVQWMTECLLYRRRFSVKGEKKTMEASMRKRLNNYAQKRRKVPLGEDAVEEEEVIREEEVMGEEGERPKDIGREHEEDEEGEGDFDREEDNEKEEEDIFQDGNLSIRVL
ncbi:hypothetical protein PFISCL1PPCAC_18199, partial [Pristionchus fissidentatus]